MDISVFGYGGKEKCLIYVWTNTLKSHADLLTIEEKGKRHYGLIIVFYTIMYALILYCPKKHFYRYTCNIKKTCW